MPSGLRKTSGNNFEIYYEQPWGGVASNASAVDIQPNQFVICNGVIALDGLLCYNQLSTGDPLYRFNFEGSNKTDSAPYLIFNCANYLCAVDQYGNFYRAFLNTDGFVDFGIDQTLPGGALTTATYPTAVQVIDNVAYVSYYSLTSLFTYTPGTSCTLASNYTAGTYMGVLDDYLLAFNTNSATDGIQLSRVNWSGPGLFSTWDPASNRTAGFNTLASSENAITGFISLASVGIIIRNKGLTEMSPTGVAIGPFQFTDLWSSVIGQGCTFPGTVIQYGANTYLFTDSGGYIINTSGGLVPISFMAQKAIYAAIIDKSAEGSILPIQPVGGFFLYPANGVSPDPQYVLVGALLIRNTPPVVGYRVLINAWFYNVITKEWYQTNFVSSSLGATNTPQISLYSSTVYLNYIPNGGGAVVQFAYPVMLTTAYGLHNVSGTIHQIAFNRIYNDINDTSSTSGIVPGPITIVFRTEEIKIYRQPTIRRVVVRAAGSGSFSLSVSGVSFGTITLDGTNDEKVYLSEEGIYTGQTPQLTVNSSNFAGYFVKFMLAGTYADGEID